MMQISKKYWLAVAASARTCSWEEIQEVVLVRPTPLSQKPLASTGPPTVTSRLRHSSGTSSMVMNLSSVAPILAETVGAVVSLLVLRRCKRRVVLPPSYCRWALSDGLESRGAPAGSFCGELAAAPGSILASLRIWEIG